MYGTKYLKIKGNQPTPNFSTYYTEDQIVNFSDAGVLVEYPWIVVDVDTIEESDLLADMLDKLKLKYGLVYTDNGSHFWFKTEIPLKNQNKMKTISGISVDIKCWGKYSMAKIKKDGVMREVAYQPPIEEVDYMPAWLRPISFVPTDFRHTGDGARHEVLLSTVFPLSRDGFTPRDIYNCLRFVNKNLMKNPLDLNDIRAMSLDNPELTKSCFYKVTPDSKRAIFDTNAVALAIQKDNKIYMDEFGTTWIYDPKEKLYVLDPLYIETEIHKLLNHLTNAQRQEVIKKLTLNLKIFGSTIKELGKHHVAVKNGILDLESGRLLPFDESIFITKRIPVSWNPLVQPNKAIDQVFSNVACGKQELQTLLFQMFGYSLSNHADYQKAFMLVGGGENGKSVIMDLLIDFLGEKNKSSVPLNGLKDPNKVALMINKYANIGDDIGKRLDETETLKSLVAGKTVLVKLLYANPFDTRLSTKLIFGANELPTTKDKTKGYFRRWIIIPFNATFSSSDKDYDPYIGEKIKTTEALQYLLLKSVNGYQELLENKKFSETEGTHQVLNEYRADQDSIFGWLEDSKYDLIGIDVEKSYDDYVFWCSKNGFRKPYEIRGFKREIPTRCGVEQKNTTRKGIQIYVWRSK